MTDWVILVDQEKDFPNADTPHKVITTREYLARPRLFRGQRPNLINLARSYAYQSRGYYCSLLAEARAHRVLPSVEVILELAGRPLYEHALPELEDTLNRAAKSPPEPPREPFRMFLCFGEAEDPRFERFARLAFDWFRCPILEISVEPGEWLTISRIRPRSVARLSPEEFAFFQTALHNYTARKFRSPRVRQPSKYDLAVLYDPKEAMPPSRFASLKHLAKVAEKLSIDVEPITKRDLSRLAEFDALWIRETTSIDNHTYRFARRAWQEGMPVIDDPMSMVRCTNKVYLNELMLAHGLPTPRTLILSGPPDLAHAAEQLGFPLVVKIPDGSFSRGVHKVDDPPALAALCERLFRETELLIAQEFLPTEFDWRIGVLGGEPLFVVQYLMAEKHWQIIKHEDGGNAVEGGFRSVALADAPPEVLDTGVRAARLIGDGLYGVDLKQNDRGSFVIEINDNPNIDHGVEDAAEKDEVWLKLTRWFVDRLA